MPHASIDALVAASAALAHTPEGTRGTASPLAEWSEAEWRTVLLAVPVDDRAFGDRYQITRQELIELLWAWWSEDARHRGEVDGYLGFFLLTLIALHCSDGMRFGDAGPEPIGADKADPAELSRDLVRDPQVRNAIAALYDPCWKEGKRLTKRSRRFSEIPENVLERWGNIDFDELSFHRSGTTSIILKGRTRRPDSDGSRRALALKCLIYPYQGIEAITKATRSYREDYRLDEDQIADIEHLVPVWASYDAWVLMNFVEGDTLAETLAAADAARPKPSREVARTVDFEQLDRLGTALLEALAELEAKGRHHGDLSPSNVIVERDGRGGKAAKLRLIDLGVNYLHRRSLSGLGRGDAVYVAPETRKTASSGALADLYSLGRLLIAIGGVPHNPDGTVPDAFYADSVGLSRLLEDLVDEEPLHRLTVVGVDMSAPLIPQITRLLALETRIAKAAEEADAGGPREKVRALMPGQGAMKRQKRILEVLETEAKDTAETHHLKQARRLRHWAQVCAWFVWIATLIILTAVARDLGYDWLIKPIEIASNLFKREDGTIPVFDDIRAEDYPIKDLSGSLPARLVALSFAVVGARWYLNVLADLTPRTAWPRTGRALALTRFNDIAMRSAACLPAVYVTVPTMIDRDWWPLFSAIGVMTVAIVNTSCLMFMRDAINRARDAGLSTVSKTDTTAMAKFTPWTPTSWLYTVPVWSIGLLLMFEVLHDELVYAVFVTTINIAMWYVVKCGLEGPYVRIALTRSYLAAERLDRLFPDPEPKPPARDREPEPEPEGVDEPALVR